MKKMFALLLIVGVLILGTFAITEEISEKVSLQYEKFSDSTIFKHPYYGDPVPCGEGGNGAPPVPG